MAETVAIQRRQPGENPYADLVPGDLWTIIRTEPIVCENGYPVRVGDVVQLVYSTADGGRLFDVVAVHPGPVYETRYAGRFSELYPPDPDRFDPYRAAVEARQAGREPL